MKKKMRSIIFLLFFVLLAACGRENAPAEGRTIRLYYLGNPETKVVAKEYTLLAEETRQQAEEIVQALSVLPDKLEYKAPLSMGFTLLNYEVAGNLLTLDVSAEYKKMKPTTEILVRAALVQSFTQIEEIGYVSITVEGEALHDALGNVVGAMTAGQFVDNEGSNINTDETIRLKLYFANESGDGLVTLYRTVSYNTNISIEKLVVEQVIAGTDATENGCYPTIGSEVQLLGVSTKDGTCYVNFDKSFLSQALKVSSEVTIYSLVNSLTELPGVSRVQILVNGEDNVLYREKYSLTTLFERNLDL